MKRTWTKFNSLTFGKCAPPPTVRTLRGSARPAIPSSALPSGPSPQPRHSSPTQPCLHASPSGAPARKDVLTHGPPAKPRCTPSPDPARPDSHVRPVSRERGSCPPPAPAPRSRPRQRSPTRPRPTPLSGHSAVTSWTRPHARRRRRAANRRLPHCGPSRARGLGPPAAGPPGPDARAQGAGPRSPAGPFAAFSPPSTPVPWLSLDPPGRFPTRKQARLAAMRLRRLALLPGVALLLATARLAAASDVLELTDDNFESRVSDTGSAGLMLVEFFAPW